MVVDDKIQELKNWADSSRQFAAGAGAPLVGNEWMMMDRIVTILQEIRANQAGYTLDTPNTEPAQDQ